MKNYYYIGLLIFLTTCSDHADFNDNPYPDYVKLETKEVTNITPSGVQFNGKVQNVKGEIIDHGFIWGDNVDLQLGNSDHNSMGPLEGGEFSETITSTLSQGLHFVRAYIKTNQTYAYGNVTSFESLGSDGPKIEDFEPKEAHHWNMITIRGSGFSNIERNNKVRFDGILGGLGSCSDSVLTVAVPYTLLTPYSKITVTVAGKTATTIDDFHLIP